MVAWARDGAVVRRNKSQDYILKVEDNAENKNKLTVSMWPEDSVPLRQAGP